MADGRSKTDEGFASCGGHWLLGSALLAVAVSSCERRCMCYKWQVATKRLTFPLVSTMVQTCNIQHLPAAGAGNACPSLPLSQRHAVDPNHPIICHLACTVTIDVAACKSGENKHETRCERLGVRESVGRLRGTGTRGGSWMAKLALDVQADMPF